MARPVARNLELLARIYGTDKSSKLHGYTKWYAHHLFPRRNTIRSVLEIGIGGTTSRTGYETVAGGQSLRMWQTYFPNARIVGVDIERKVVTGPRISVEQGSQDDPAFLADVARRHGPFDLIIDDGSHIGRHVQASFEALFEHVRPGGLYIIEDAPDFYLVGDLHIEILPWRTCETGKAALPARPAHSPNSSSLWWTMSSAVIGTLRTPPGR
jgi:demethylmacrocin O-methyltransferase